MERSFAYGIKMALALSRIAKSVSNMRTVFYSWRTKMKYEIVMIQFAGGIEVKSDPEFEGSLEEAIREATQWLMEEGKLDWIVEISDPTTGEVVCVIKKIIRSCGEE